MPSQVKSFTSAVKQSAQRFAKVKPIAKSARGVPERRWERIYAVVRRIPRRRVATYGQVAALAGLPRHARQVGYALHALPEGTDVPWHRVVNAKGEVSFSLSRNGGDILQRRLLEKEGIKFDETNRLDLERYRWLD